jgi:hypothetical protein
VTKRSSKRTIRAMRLTSVVKGDKGKRANGSMQPNKRTDPGLNDHVVCSLWPGCNKQPSNIPQEDNWPDPGSRLGVHLRPSEPCLPVSVLPHHSPIQHRSLTSLTTTRHSPTLNHHRQPTSPSTLSMSARPRSTDVNAHRTSLTTGMMRWLNRRYDAWKSQRAVEHKSGYVVARRMACKMARIWGLHPTACKRAYHGGERAYLFAFERLCQVQSHFTRLNSIADVTI